MRKPWGFNGYKTLKKIVVSLTFQIDIIFIYNPNKKEHEKKNLETYVHVVGNGRWSDKTAGRDAVGSAFKRYPESRKESCALSDKWNNGENGNLKHSATNIILLS